MGRHRYTKHDRVKFDFSWLLPKFEWRWVACFVLLGTVGLYEFSIWRSCSHNISYHYYKDMRVSEHPACTHESDTFRHRPMFAEQCEDALRSTNADILHSNKFKCFWAEQPLSLGKWEALALLSVLGYVSMRMYLEYSRRLEERRISSRESRRAIEHLSSAMPFPRFGWPEELPYSKPRDVRQRSPVRIEPYFDSD